VNAKVVNTDFSQKRLTLLVRRGESCLIIDGRKENEKMIDCSKTKNYLSEKNRMVKSDNEGACHIACINCPLSRYNNGKNILCTTLESQHHEIAIKLVQKWSDGNPRKTYLSEFLRNYPNATLTDAGVPDICPHILGLTDKHCKRSCVECWNQSSID
jgi:hypothetical protein